MIAGIDYGRVRIGIAIADERVRIASPHANYTRVGEAADARFFQQLVTEEQIDRFVVGLPVHLDGQESQISGEAREYGAWLEKRTGVPVEFFDERFTSREALDHLSEANLSQKKRKQRLDKVAAQIMLTAYLEKPLRSTDPPAGLDESK